MSYKTIGKQLQSAREEAGYSQEQLASKIGCSQSTLSNYEKGKRRIYLAQLEKIAEVLNRPVEFFLRHTDYSPPQDDRYDIGEYSVLPQPAWSEMDPYTEMVQGGHDEERVLLESFRSLSAEGRKLVQGFTDWVRKREVTGNG